MTTAGRPAARVVGAHALAATGMSLPWPLLLLLVWESTGSTLLLGLAGAARMLPYVLLSWWVGGVVADRWDRDAVVRVTLVLRLALLAAGWAAVSSGALVAAVAACTLAVAVATPAYPAAVAGGAGLRGWTGRHTELVVTVEVASFVVGPAAGGVLLARPGLVLPVALGATLAALAVMTGVRMPRPAPAMPTPSAVAASSAVDTWPAVATWPSATVPPRQAEIGASCALDDLRTTDISPQAEIGASCALDDARMTDISLLVEGSAAAVPGHHAAPGQTAAPPRAAAKGRAVAWWPVVRASREVRASVGVMAALNAVLAGTGVALLVGAEGGWSSPWTPDVAYGAATAALGFASLAGPLLARLGRGPAGRMRAGVLLAGSGLLVAAVAPGVLWVLVPLAVVGAAAVHAEAAATAVLQVHVPDRARASVLGLADTAMIGAALLGSVLAPPVAQALGAGPTLLVLAGGLTLVLLHLRRA